tara:strand:+ start:179 stop:1042 length:864 start_codon:yes stop_codon:yes gene_type:complete
MSEENIVGGLYGAEVDAETASGLMVDESIAAEPSSESNDPNSEVTTEPDQTQETEQLDQVEEAPSIEEIEINGKNYSYEDLELALDDSQNRSEWQKSNTQKAQELAEMRKELESERGKFNSIREDEDLMDTLKDYLGEDHTIFKSIEEPVNVPNQDTTESNPLENRISELEGKLQEREAVAEVERDIASLVKAHPELEGRNDAIEQVLETAVAKNLDNLEDAFVLTNHQATEESAFAKAKKTLEEANSAKAIPEASVKHDGDRSPTNAKAKDFDEAREMALKYDLFA